MLFKDKLEIWNPGYLPLGLTVAKLREPHSSIPANPLLAEPMYLAGYIERLGTGTGDMIRLCSEAGLKEPDFVQDDIFKAVIWREKKESVEVTAEVTAEVTKEIKRLAVVLVEEMKRSEIQRVLGLKHDENFRSNYILPALAAEYIEMTIPDSPKSPKQKYRLTEKGLKLKKMFEKR